MSVRSYGANWLQLFLYSDGKDTQLVNQLKEACQQVMDHKSLSFVAYLELQKQRDCHVPSKPQLVNYQVEHLALFEKDFANFYGDLQLASFMGIKGLYGIIRIFLMNKSRKV